MKRSQYFLAILATILVVGSSTPAGASTQVKLLVESSKKIISLTESIPNWFRKANIQKEFTNINHEEEILLGQKKTGTILRKIGTESVKGTLPPLQESINLDSLHDKGQTKNAVQTIGVAVGATTAAGGTAYSTIKSTNDKDNQNNRSKTQSKLSVGSKKPLKLVLHH
ncbi:hypothetical protein [Limnofasciculus baicalensis]|uniref:Uncharacterized protein n=1 Tax=Limnofasciculus baicalensis BBK-W-15 TaxID=2699891 RepID=A0AAE3GQK2_9CYAN|nr:hypothetical protein [Limnofasciculus baicalensis]MCP2728247.1 hypothetical protein [Limnofasciculus baicalensis BBK-W-15]